MKKWNKVHVAIPVCIRSDSESYCLKKISSHALSQALLRNRCGRLSIGELCVCAVVWHHFDQEGGALDDAAGGDPALGAAYCHDAGTGDRGAGGCCRGCGPGYEGGGLCCGGGPWGVA